MELELKQEIRLIITLGKNAASLFENSWSGETKRYKRVMLKKDCIQGNPSSILEIKTMDGQSVAALTLVCLPSKIKTEDISSLVEIVLGPELESQALIIGTEGGLQQFLPKNPKVGSRYQSIVNIPGAKWGVLIRKREEDMFFGKNTSGNRIASFIKEIASLILNFKREQTAPDGKLYSATRRSNNSQNKKNEALLASSSIAWLLPLNRKF